MRVVVAYQLKTRAAVVVAGAGDVAASPPSACAIGFRLMTVNAAGHAHPGCAAAVVVAPSRGKDTSGPLPLGSIPACMRAPAGLAHRREPLDGGARWSKPARALRRGGLDGATHRRRHEGSGGKAPPSLSLVARSPVAAVG